MLRQRATNLSSLKQLSIDESTVVAKRDDLEWAKADDCRGWIGPGLADVERSFQKINTLH
jgi:hypothetical protein